MSIPQVVIVPGLRDHVSDHWQTHLEHVLRELGRKVVTVPPMGRSELNCSARLQAIDEVVRSIDGPTVLVAHSGGCIMVARWAAASPLVGRVRAALLATPPDFEHPMPDSYPTMTELKTAGWFPVPRRPLPWPSLVLLSRNDPLGSFDRVSDLAMAWNAKAVDLGEVGHLNPSSGYGEWPGVMDYLQQLENWALTGNEKM